MYTKTNKYKNGKTTPPALVVAVAVVFCLHNIAIRVAVAEHRVLPILQQLKGQYQEIAVAEHRVLPILQQIKEQIQDMAVAEHRVLHILRQIKGTM